MRRALLISAILICWFSTELSAQNRAIDTGRSTLTVHVAKSGLFAAFAHNHEIEAPIAAGSVTLSAPMSVTLRVETAKLRVIDREVSASDRAKIQATMEGVEVLDAPRFSEIVFTSTAVEGGAGDRWTVKGNLTLHGQTHPVSVEVALTGGHYRGSAMLSQRAFGIAPISIGGGTVKVKDELKIDFDIVLSG